MKKISIWPLLLFAGAGLSGCMETEPDMPVIPQTHTDRPHVIGPFPADTRVVLNKDTKYNYAGNSDHLVLDGGAYVLIDPNSSYIPEFTIELPGTKLTTSSAELVVEGRVDYGPPPAGGMKTLSISVLAGTVRVKNPGLDTALGVGGYRIGSNFVLPVQNWVPDDLKWVYDCLYYESLSMENLGYLLNSLYGITIKYDLNVNWAHLENVQLDIRKPLPDNLEYLARAGNLRFEFVDYIEGIVKVHKK